MRKQGKREGCKRIQEKIGENGRKQVKTCENRRKVEENRRIHEKTGEKRRM